MYITDFLQTYFVVELFVFVKSFTKNYYNWQSDTMETYKTDQYYILSCRAARVRETVPSQTSDMGKKTVPVLAHSFWLP